MYEPKAWDSSENQCLGKRKNRPYCQNFEDGEVDEINAMTILAKILSLNVDSLVTSQQAACVDNRTRSPSWVNARRIVMAQFFREQNNTAQQLDSSKLPNKVPVADVPRNEQNKIGDMGEPWAPPASYRSIKSLKSSPIQVARRPERRILIVDDSACTRLLFNQMLVHYEIHFATNGKLGFSMMQNRIYDMVFMDLEMPTMNGFHAVQAIRRWEKKVKRPQRQKICALSAHHTQTEIKLAMLVGMQAFIRKPFRRSDLHDIIEGNFGQISNCMRDCTTEDDDPHATEDDANHVFQSA